MKDKDQGDQGEGITEPTRMSRLQDAGLERAAHYFPEDVLVAITTAGEIRNAMRLLRSQRPEPFAADRSEEEQ